MYPSSNNISQQWTSSLATGSRSETYQRSPATSSAVHSRNVPITNNPAQNSAPRHNSNWNSNPSGLRTGNNQIALIRHVQGCSGIGSNYCMVRSCQDMKNLLRHIEQCNLINCSTEDCAFTKQCLYHINNCTNQNCSICHYSRHYGTNSSVMNNQPVQRMSTQLPFTQPAYVAQALHSNRVQLLRLRQMSQFGSTSQVSSSQSQLLQPPVSQYNVPITNPWISTNTLASHTPNPAINNFMPISHNRAALGPSNVPLGANSQVQSTQQTWHDQVDTELREHLIQNLIQTINRENYLDEMNRYVAEGKISNNFEQYVRKVEADIYMKANSKSDFYNLIASKFLHMTNTNR